METALHVSCIYLSLAKWHWFFVQEVCIVNTFGRQRQCLPWGQRADFFFSFFFDRFFSWPRQEKCISPGHILGIFASIFWYDWGLPRFEVLQLWPNLQYVQHLPLGARVINVNINLMLYALLKGMKSLVSDTGVFCQHLWNCATTCYYRSWVKIQTLRTLGKFILLKFSIKTHLTQW